MVNVTKSNFLEQSNDLIANLPHASFVAIDEEMTGISLPNASRPSKDDTPERRYTAIKAVPERYSIIQFGVALFMKDREEGFTVKKYNFYLFPSSNSEKEVTMNPSSIAFLKEHGMNFNLWTKEGIPFATCEQVPELIAKYKKKALGLMTDAPMKAFDPQRRAVELTRPDDINVHAHAMASLREWLDSARPANEEGTSFSLPPVNAFLRRALYESIGNEYPSLVLEKVNHNQIRVLRMTAEEKEVRRQRQREEAWKWFVVQELGFWRVFYALSQHNQGMVPMNSLALASSLDEVGLDDVLELKPSRKIPIVVHNGLMDLLFLMTHCHAPTLPDKYSDCKALLKRFFPLVYDTKVIATEGPSRHENTVLSQLFSSVVSEAVAVDLYLAETSIQNHEASHDAYMTGAVFYGLCLAAAPEDGIFPWSEGDNHAVNRRRYVLNKLYLMLTMYTIDLEAADDEDPLSRGMHLDAAYRVTGSDKSVTTRDIIRCLSSLTSPFPNTRVHFEIVWVDDVTFIVAARDEGNFERLMRHGSIIETALRERFTKSTVVCLRGYLAKERQNKVEAVERQSKKRKQPKPWGLMNWLMEAFRNDGEETEGGDEQSAKRRRVDRS